MELVDRVAIVHDTENKMTCLEAIELAKQKDSVYGPNIDLAAGKVYWLIFEVANNGKHRDINLKDSFSELKNSVKGIYLVDENSKVVSSYCTLRIYPDKSRIIALKLIPKHYSFSGILRLCPKFSYFSLSYVINNFTPINWMVMFLLISLIAIIIIFEIYQSVTYLLLYLMSEMFVGFGRYFLEIGVISVESQNVFMNILAVVKYTCLIHLAFIFFNYKRLEVLGLLTQICQYLLWFVLSAMFFWGSYSPIFSQIINIITLCALFLITFMSFMLYYFYLRKKNLILGISFLFVFMCKINEMFGYSTFLFVSFDNLIYICHNIIIILFVTIKSIKTRWCEKALAMNSDIAFKALRDSYTLKDTLSKFIIYSNFNMDFDAIYVYLENKVGLHYYASFPENDIFGSNEVKVIVEAADRDKTIVTEHLQYDPIYKENPISKFYKSMIILPLRIDTKYLGSLVFFSSKKSSFTKTAIMFARELSYKAAVILNNYRQIELLNIYNKRVQFEETLRIFQRNTAHDIKAPLRGIKISVSILMKKYAHDKALFEYLEQVDYAVDSAIEQVKESISMIAEMKEDFDISYLSGELSDLRKLCKMEGIALIEDIQVNDLLFGPKKSVRNMLRSIVKNAIEALELLERDSKEVRVRYYKNEDDKLVITVKDNGIGINDYVKKKMLSNESYTHGKKEGTGHGMMIAKYIVDKLSGDIIIDSVEHEYTVVTVIIDVIKSNLKLED